MIGSFRLTQIGEFQPTRIGAFRPTQFGEFRPTRTESLLFATRRAVAGMEKSEHAKKSAKYKKMKERIKVLE